MKNVLLLCLFCCACQNKEQEPKSKSDSWTAFKKCATTNCVPEVIAVKDAFLKNPASVLADFQATYEIGEDHVLGWLFILRDSVLMNPKMGTVETRYAMQQSVIEAAKPFEKDAKVHEMAQSVINELKIADIKGGKVIDPMAAAPTSAPTSAPALAPKPESASAPTSAMKATYCYQSKKDGETMSCQLSVNEKGDFTGYYAWYIEEKDGTQGILKGKNSFKSDTLIIEHKYIQEGEMAKESLFFVKKGDNLVHLESTEVDKNGKMVFTNKKKLKLGNTLKKIDCAKLKTDIQPIQAMEKEFK
jgi:hypothetical protein